VGGDNTDFVEEERLRNARSSVGGGRCAWWRQRLQLVLLLQSAPNDQLDDWMRLIELIDSADDDVS